jgi:hypothetical protein
MQDEDEICKVTDDANRVHKRSATRAMNVQNALLARDINYSDYLQLDKILDAQAHIFFNEYAMNVSGCRRDN